MGGGDDDDEVTCMKKAGIIMRMLIRISIEGSWHAPLGIVDSAKNNRQSGCSTDDVDGSAAETSAATTSRWVRDDAINNIEGFNNILYRSHNRTLVALRSSALKL